MKTNLYPLFKFHVNLFSGLLFIFLFFFQGCVSEVEEKTLYRNDQILLTDIMKADPTLTITLQALEKINLAHTLNTYGPYTFFAPNNQAFEKYFQQIGVSGLDQISVDDLRTILQYHILNKRVRAADFVQGTLPDSTVNGDYLNLDLSGGLTTGTKINDKARIYETNIISNNAMLHKIDAVLDPPINTLADYLASEPSLSVLAAGMERAGLMDTLNTIRSINYRRVYTFKTPLKLKTHLTLFAETDAVFNAAGITLQTIENMPLPALQRLMRYHLVPGQLTTNKIVPATNYTGLGVFSNGMLDAINLATLSPNDFINYDRQQTNKINQSVNLKPNGNDKIVKNGIVHFIDKPLQIVDISTVRRIPIVHETGLSRWYAFGAAVNSNTPRVFGPEKASNFRPAAYFAFMVADSPGDSMVTLIPGIQKGKYKITINYKSGGNRNNVQPLLGGKSTGLSKIDLRSSPTYHQNRVISNSYTFNTSGTKRMAFMSTDFSGRYEIAIDAIVLTPIP